MLYRELHYFEQLATLERAGASRRRDDRVLMGRQLPDRWDLWEPALTATYGADAYPLFRALAQKMRGRG